MTADQLEILIKILAIGQKVAKEEHKDYDEIPSQIMVNLSLQNTYERFLERKKGRYQTHDKKELLDKIL